MRFGKVQKELAMGTPLSTGVELLLYVTVIGAQPATDEGAMEARGRAKISIPTKVYVPMHPTEFVAVSVMS